MKRLLVWMISVCFCIGVHGQAQELEQLRINLEKLVQLRLMLSQAKQGYQTLERGYNGIREAAKGNFDLHKRKLDELLLVSEVVKRSAAAALFKQHLAFVGQESSDWLRLVAGLGLFQAKELADMRAAIRPLEEQLQVIGEQVQMVLSPGVLRMNEAERLSMLERLTDQSETCLLAVREQIEQQKMIAVKRAQAKKDNQAVKRLYGL